MLLLDHALSRLTGTQRIPDEMIYNWFEYTPTLAIYQLYTCHDPKSSKFGSTIWSRLAPQVQTSSNSHLNLLGYSCFVSVSWGFSSTPNVPDSFARHRNCKCVHTTNLWVGAHLETFLKSGMLTFWAHSAATTNSFSFHSTSARGHLPGMHGSA